MGSTTFTHEKHAGVLMGWAWISNLGPLKFGAGLGEVIECPKLSQLGQSKKCL